MLYESQNSKFQLRILGLKASAEKGVRTRLEEFAKKSRLLEKALDSIVEGIVVLDADLKLVAFNKRSVELRDYPPGFLRVGMPIEELYRYKAESGYYGPGDVETQIAERIEKKRLPRTESKERVRSDGTVVSVHRELMPDGGHVTTYTDITEMKKAEKEQARQSALLGSVLENMAQGVIVYDADDKLIASNRQFEVMIGVPRGTIRTGMTHEEIRRFRVRAGHFGPGGEEALVRKGSTWAQGITERTNERTFANGTTILYHRKPMPGGGSVVTYTDITKRKRMEEDLRFAMEQSESANHSKSEFLATMSHELRTPLNSIIGLSEMMAKGIYGPLGNKKYREFAADVVTSGHHLLSLINDILDLSKAAAGKLELNEEVVDMAGVVQSCIRLFNEQARRQGVALKAEISDPVLPLYVDERLVRQIIINLLSNAIKFTPEGGKVTLKIFGQPGAGQILQVIDTGIGIALKDFAKIGKPFTQIESAYDSKHQGTGLGLSLCKKFIELHGGSLDFQSVLGKGFKVTVRFPNERSLPPTGNFENTLN